MAAERFLRNFGQAHAFNLRGRAGEVITHEFARKPYGIKNLRATIRLVSGNAHLGHHFQQALVNRLDIALHGFIG